MSEAGCEWADSARVEKTHIGGEVRFSLQIQNNLDGGNSTQWGLFGFNAQRDGGSSLLLIPMVEEH